MPLQTTGAITTTAFDTRTVIDRAYGVLGLTPQQITGEKITIAQDLLGLTLTDLINTANPLWCREKILVTLINGQREYILPVGTNDVNRAFFRTTSNVTPTVFTSTPSAYVLDFGAGNDTQVTTWALDWIGQAVAVTFQVSEDGTTWSTVGNSGLVSSLATGTVWYDVKVSNPARFWQVIPTAVGTSLSVTAGRVYNTPNDIMMYRMNKDDYWNMTNKFFPGRPLQFYLRRDLTPVMELWPQPNLLASQGLMPVYRERHIMDVGSLQQTIEVPTRWYYTIIFLLADSLVFCTPEAKADRVAIVQARLPKMLATTWTEERDKSPVKFQFNLRAYTR